MGILDRFRSCNETETAYGVEVHGPKRRDHYGWCFSCGESWKNVEHATVDYDDGKGAFPLCVGCFEQRSVDQIVSYFKYLYTGGCQLCWGRRPNEEHFKTFEENVREIKHS